MKLKILFIFTFVLINSTIYSQTYFGFKVGGNASNIIGDNEIQGMKFAMHVGAVAEIQVSDLFSIQPELLFSIQGSEKKLNANLVQDNEYIMVNGHYVSLPIKDYDNIDDVKLKNNNYYISLPIMVKYFVSEFISIDLGPQISYLTFAQISNGSKEWTDVKDSYNALDYGVNLGASYEMDNGMNINIRYNYNFANVYKSDYFDLKANNTNIQVSLGYKFY
jgi:hypothetical protein